MIPARHLKIWFLALLVSAIATAYAFRHVDVAMVRQMEPLMSKVEMLGEGLGSSLILTGELVVFLVLLVMRAVRGSISPFSKATAIACIASICTYAINAHVLKVLFGVLPPWEVLGGAPHVASLLHGSPNASFPSGHMALAGAFAGVYMRLYPKAWVIGVFSGLLAIAASLLVIGNWHFVSDVIAGAFTGLTAGILAAALWDAHGHKIMPA